VSPASQPATQEPGDPEGGHRRPPRTTASTPLPESTTLLPTPRSKVERWTYWNRWISGV